MAAPDPVQCGRKFCSGCGRWRQVVDFGQIRGRFRARCRLCFRMEQRGWWANMTPEQRERSREYQRIWHEVKRREAGVPVRQSRRRSVIDQIERVLLEAAPLLAEVEDYWHRQRLYGDPDYDWNTLAAAAGVSERGLFRLRKENRFVRLDFADKLAVAIGVPLSLIYPYDESEAA